MVFCLISLRCIPFLEELKMKDFYKAVTDHVLTRLPIDNELLRALSCLHPNNRQQASGVKKIKYVAEKMPCVKTEEISSVVDEWKLYMEVEIPKSWYKVEHDDYEEVKRVDEYWAKVLALKNTISEAKFPLLAKVVKCSLSLSHGNADTERSLSCNKRMLTSERTSMSATSINGCRAVKDGVRTKGEPQDVPVTREMLSSCKAAHSVYQCRMKEEREKLEEKRKQQRQREEERQEKEKLEKERLERLKSLKESERTTKEKEKEAQEEFKKAQALLNEGQKRLDEALKSKDMHSITVASGLIQLGRQNLEKSEKSMNAVADKKRKLMAGYEKVAKKSKPT